MKLIITAINISNYKSDETITSLIEKYNDRLEMKIKMKI